MEPGPLLLTMLAAALACVGTAVACRDRFRRSLVMEMVLAGLAGGALWCLVTIATAWATQHEVVWLLARLEIVGAGTVATAWWCLARAVTDPSWRLPPAALAGVWVGGVAVVALASKVGPTVLSLTTEPGSAAEHVVGWAAELSWDRLLVAAVLLAALARLFGVRRHVPAFARSPLRTLSLAVLLVMLTTAATVTTPDLLGGVDYAPLGSAVAGLLSADVLMRRQFLRLAPPSAEQVLESLTDAVVVLEPDGRILSMNESARRLATGAAVTLPVELLLGRHAGHVLHPAVAAALGAPRGFAATVATASGLHFDIRAHLLADGAGEHLGVVVVAREVEALVSRQAQTEMAYAGLQQEKGKVEAVVSRLLWELSDTEQQRTRLAEDVVRDALTGLHNRRQLEPAIQAALERSRYTGGPFSVLMVDVDHFKRVNDTHGHPVGDRVLQALARELMIDTQQGESVVRYGGEEFVVVLPGVAPFDALRRAEEIRRGVAGLRVPLRSEQADRELSITVSVGVSSYPMSGGTVRDLILAADDALYAAKAAGRDCVVAA